MAASAVEAIFSRDAETVRGLKQVPSSTTAMPQITQ